MGIWKKGGEGCILYFVDMADLSQGLRFSPGFSLLCPVDHPSLASNVLPVSVPVTLAMFGFAFLYSFCQVLGRLGAVSGLALASFPSPWNT